MKLKLLLHICCATCAAYVLDLLRRDYQVTAFFYNPNIYPEEEYQHRFNEAKAYCRKNNITFIVESPDQNQWFLLTKGYEDDPERGNRCTICYRMRLKKTAEYAQTHDFDLWGTDLSISPHKDVKRISRLGKELAEKCNVKFLEADFKKQDGFKKAMVVSKSEGFYRQSYCGCIYSLKAGKK